jgi:hypothetical protein
MCFPSWSRTARGWNRSLLHHATRYRVTLPQHLRALFSKWQFNWMAKAFAPPSHIWVSRVAKMVMQKLLGWNENPNKIEKRAWRR